MDGRQTLARCRGFEGRVTQLEPLGFCLRTGYFESETVTACCHRVRRTGQMARITLRQLLDHAAEHDYGVPAFNINNMEQALAIMDAASTPDAPAIIQSTRGALAYPNEAM